MANERFKVGDVVRWKEQYRKKWPDYPEPLIVVKAGQYVTVRDATGMIRNFSPDVPFSPFWFELDPFLTAVHQRRKHGK